MSAVRISLDTKRSDQPERQDPHAQASQCAQATGLPRFRDRHQARDGAKAFTFGRPGRQASMFACPECRGWHVETRPSQRGPHRRLLRRHGP